MKVRGCHFEPSWPSAGAEMGLKGPSLDVNWELNGLQNRSKTRPKIIGKIKPIFDGFVESILLNFGCHNAFNFE